MTPLDVLLLSYIKGCFVYCPFLLVQFKNYIGGIAMPRKYEKVQELLPVVKDMVEAGYTYRQIAEKLGLGGKEVIEELLKRERRKAAQGVPMHRGRKPAKTLQEYKYENKRLKMEVELLRDFLSLTGKE